MGHVYQCDACKKYIQDTYDLAGVFGNVGVVRFERSITPEVSHNESVLLCRDCYKKVAELAGAHNGED